MIWHWPQIAIVVLFAVNVGVSLASHGQLSKRPTNGWTAIVGAALILGILYAGGFWGAS